MSVNLARALSAFGRRDKSAQVFTVEPDRWFGDRPPDIASLTADQGLSAIIADD